MYSSETTFLNKVLCNWERFFFFSDCIKAQNPVSSGTFLFLFSFTSSMAKSPCVLSFSAPLISLTIFEENHQQIMLMVCQIWSCEAICPSIPKFHLAKPTQFLPHPSAPKPSKNKNNNNTTSWQDEHRSVSMSAASSLKPNLFFTSFFERSKTDFEENIMAGLFLFFFPF